MELSINTFGHIGEISLNGRLDAASSNAVLEAFSDKALSGICNIVMDFSKLDYISSSGLRVLLMATKDLKAKNGRLVLYGVNSHVREVFNLAGFMPYFSMFGSREEAISDLK